MTHQVATARLRRPAAPVRDSTASVLHASDGSHGIIGGTMEGLTTSGGAGRLPEDGQVINGTYRIIRQIGSGGMGVVYLALNLVANQMRALKFLLLSEREVPEHRAMLEARFRNEATFLSTIRLPGIVMVYEIGAFGEGGLPFFVMEHIEGHSLEQRLQSGGAVPIGDALRYVHDVAKALQPIHEQYGVCHRDLKPANVFIRNVDQSVVVLDFGIADTGRADHLTRTGQIIGTPHYMAPEQMLARKDVDARADIFALGVVLFELLTNEKPFPGESAPECFANTLGGKHRDIRQLATVPENLAGAVEKALHLDRDARFQSCAELLDALGACMSQLSAPAQRKSLPNAPTVAGGDAATIRPGSTNAQTPPNATVLRGAPRGRLPVVIAAGAALALIVGITTWFVTRTPATTSTVKPPSDDTAKRPPEATPVTQPPTSERTTASTVEARDRGKATSDTPRSTGTQPPPTTRGDAAPPVKHSKHGKQRPVTSNGTASPWESP